MLHSKKIFKFFFLLCLSLSFTQVRASDDLSNEDVSSLIEIRDEDRYLVYGDYAEVEITSKKKINLSFKNEITAFGMELEKIDENSYLLFGAPLFLGKLCFYMDVQTLRGEQSIERLCLYGDPNEEIQYPEYVEERFLKSVNTYEQFSVNFKVKDYDQDVFQSMVNPISSELNVDRNYKGQITLAGSISTAGIYEFVVKSKESENDVAVYKQFMLEVTESSSGGDNTTQCAPGYYWDDYLNYCVQASGRTCGYGTWYDYESNTCRAYRSVNYCRAGTYWDHWLNRCVISTAKRCPINYEWDRYYGRCVRLPYTCSFNQTYDYSLKRCVRLYRSRVCSVGYHWSSFRLSCVRNVRSCFRGEYWNGYSCTRTRRVCRGGNYYDPVYGRCTSRGTVRTCSPGYSWNSRSRSCVGRVRTGERVCPRGQRYSGRSARCIGHNPRRVERHRNRVPHRPRRGGTTRPDRPRNGGGTTRPDRPRNGGGTTRPDRPRNGGGTTRPDRPRRGGGTTRPDRPRRGGGTTRPDRPRNDGGTTRPDRPRRPSTPTTRPDRPRNGGGTTRPDRPRNGGGTTRPDRPRNGGGTTRPDRPRNGGGTTRPDRPRSGGGTTRPDRPRSGGGTTRPDRPRRPSTPTTRPDRPRNGGGTTRPDRPRRPRSGGATTRPSRPRSGGATTSPSRPSRGSGGSTTSPSRPSRGSGGSTTRPSRPSRGSGGSTTRPSRPSRGGNDGGGQRRRRPKPE